MVREKGPFYVAQQELLSEPLFAETHWNLMAVFILSFRHLLYSGRAPELGHIAYLVVVSIVAFVGGWAIFVKQSRRLAEEL